MASTKAATVLLLLTVATSATASKVKFNVTEMLGEFPEFSTFNNLLSQTKLADEINQRQTITVLVVDNSAASAITSLPAETQRKVLAVQVILDYYDPVKLDGITNKTARLTTLFQATGAANDHMGFVNYTEGTDDQMAFGSAEPGAPMNSKLVKVVASRPYNISVMQVSAPIVLPSIGESGSGKGGATPPSAAKANVSSEAPAPSKKPEAAEEESAPTTDDAEAPAPSEDASATVTDSPPDADAPATSQPEPEKSTDVTADAPTSSGSRVLATGPSVGLIGLVMFMI